ncbi:MAG: sialate O-acetylesterase [bacterium]
MNPRTCSLPRLLLHFLLLIIAACQLQAEIKPNALFSDGMILQRDTVVPVWGNAAPGEQISVEFAGQKKSTTADSTGKWMVKLDPLKANASAQDLTITGSGAPIKLTNVLVGDVWLAGGQSNMGSPIFAAHNATEVLPTANDPLLRFFDVKKKVSSEPLPNQEGQWKETTPDNAKNFSAVGFFFAREIRKSAGVPVGVISAPWGGTPIETWMSLKSLNENPALTNVLVKWDKAVTDNAKVKADPKLVSDFVADLENWNKEVKPAADAAMKAWNDDKAAGKPVGEKPKPSRPVPSNPDPMGMPDPSRRPATPTVSYNAMIAPLAPYAIRGVIWYQGEANASRGLEYRTLFPRLIQGWRAQWGTDFPFLFVQLPMNGPDKTPVATDGEPYLREAQFLTLKEPKTSMAITIDIGDPNNVHPGDKIDVGQRLSLLARRDVYGEKINASGPLYQGFKVEGDKVHISLKETGSGLKAGQAPWCAKGVEPLPTDKLIGFFIAGDDKSWVEAEAKIDGNSVVVSSPSVPKPASVRYGWANSPRCNLYNSEGLPASPFRTDDWQSGSGAGTTNPSTPAIRTTE